MLSYVFDVLFLALVIGCTAFLIRRPLIDSAVTWLAFLLSALIALNCFEPLAEFVTRRMFAATDVWFTCYLWFAFIWLIFVWFCIMISIGFQHVLGVASLNLGRFDPLGKWIFSLLSGYTLAAFALVSVHTLPVSWDFDGAFPPELSRRTGPVMKFAPDYQLLTLTEYICNPRETLTGMPWASRGPLADTTLNENRWSSFPVRYALWRESTRSLLRKYVRPEEMEIASNEEDDLEV